MTEFKENKLSEYINKQVLYAYKVSLGIKIGYSGDYDKRKKQHQTSGEIIKEIRVISIENKDIDINLKKLLFDLGKRVNIENSTCTEVYKITINQLNLIFDHIVNHNNINKIVLNRIFNNTRNPEIISIKSYVERVKNNYYYHFKHQRPIDIKHVDKIYNYIMNNYNSNYFYLSSILINIDVILDGMHRTEAFIKIYDEFINNPFGEEILNSVILLDHINKELTEIEQLQLFCKFNSDKPMSPLYFDSDYTDRLFNKCLENLRKKYGKNSIVRDIKSSSVQENIKKFQIRELCEEYYVKLIGMEIISGSIENELSELIIKTNDIYVSGLCEYIENYDIFNRGYDVKNYEKNICDYINKINDYQYSSNTIMKKFLIIRDNCNINKNEPFILGMFPKFNLFELITNAEKNLKIFNIIIN